jgi:cardiolipin synthase
MFIHAIDSARERLWIANPYFVPDKPVIDALQLAGLLGVKVRILISNTSDNLPADIAGSSYVNDPSLARAKLNAYRFGSLYENVMLIDRSTTTVDTTNFDDSSFRANFQITALISETTFVSKHDRMYEADLSKSRATDPSDHECKSRWFRFGSRLERLTGAIEERMIASLP